jgi:hypothetical protein
MSGREIDIKPLSLIQDTGQEDGDGAIKMNIPGMKNVKNEPVVKTLFGSRPANVIMKGKETSGEPISNSSLCGNPSKAKKVWKGGPLELPRCSLIQQHNYLQLDHIKERSEGSGTNTLPLHPNIKSGVLSNDNWYAQQII